MDQAREDTLTYLDEFFAEFQAPGPFGKFLDRCELFEGGALITRALFFSYEPDSDTLRVAAIYLDAGDMIMSRGEFLDRARAYY
ncbi:MAG: hypothetical protein AAFR93_07100, partial [Pseudomonadota bacterium]